MSDLSATARERAVLATVADAIVAASVGRGLRVVVACPHTHRAVVDHLAQALHARGRACRCLPVEPNSDEVGALPADRHEDGTVVMIISGLVTEADRFVQRVNISVTAAAEAPAGDAGFQEPGDFPSTEGGELDIILDYRDPDGPVIRYMAERLRAGDRP